MIDWESLAAVYCVVLWFASVLVAGEVRDYAMRWSWVSGRSSATGCAALSVVLAPAVAPAVLAVMLLSLLMNVCSFIFDLLALLVYGND